MATNPNPNPRSHLNHSVIEGHLVADPKGRELPSGTYITEAQLATTEQWFGVGGVIKEHTSFLGIVAHGPVARVLEAMTKGAHIYVIGRWRTVEGPEGPRGGKTTSTKLRAIHILPVFAAPEITDDLTS